MYMKEAIEKFIASRNGSTEKRECQKLLNKLFNDELMNTEIAEFNIGRKYGLYICDEFTDEINRRRQGKETTYDRLKRFVIYLNKNSEFEQDVDEIFGNIRPMIPIERQLNLLKFLQGEDAISMDEIVGRFALDERNIREDLNKIEMEGIEFLDQEIKLKIEGNRRDKKYLSTAHPIFLPLNMREAYVMTVGLKKLSMVERNQYSHVLSYVADWIYSQLSDYGTNIINKSLKQKINKRVHFDKRYSGYEYERGQIRNSIEDEILYLEKSMRPFEIILKNNEKSIKAKRVHINYEDNNKYIIARVKGEDIKIPIDDILELVYEYK